MRSNSFLPSCRDQLQWLAQLPEASKSEILKQLKLSYRKSCSFCLDLSEHLLLWCFFSEPSCHAARNPSLVEGSHIITLVDDPSWAHGQQPASSASIVSDPSWTCIPGEASDGNGPADIWPNLHEKCCVKLLGWAQSFPLHGNIRDSNTLLAEVTKGLFVTQCHAIVRYYFRAISHYTPRGNTTPIQLKHSYYGEQELMTLRSFLVW